MKNFTVILDSKDSMWHVHRADCQNLGKALRGGHNSSAAYQGENAKDVANQVIDEDMKDMGYTLDDVKIHDCAKK